jgi:hypothetical protein
MWVKIWYFSAPQPVILRRIGSAEWISHADTRSRKRNTATVEHQDSRATRREPPQSSMWEALPSGDGFLSLRFQDFSFSK